MATSSAVPPIVYATFSLGINQDSTQKLFQSLAVAMANNVQHVHLVFHTSGGNVGDGIAIYNYFKTLPIDLTLYNTGIVASVGVVAYLGAKFRKVSRYGTFGIHRSQISIQRATANTMTAMAEGAIIDDQRTEAILREYIQLPAKKWDDLNHYDLNFSAEDSVKIGFAQEIGEFSPPPGSRVFNIA